MGLARCHRPGRSGPGCSPGSPWAARRWQACWPPTRALSPVQAPSPSPPCTAGPSASLPLPVLCCVFRLLCDVLHPPPPLGHSDVPQACWCFSRKSCSWYVTRVGEEWAQIWGRRRGVPHQCRPCGGRRLWSRRWLSTSMLPASLSVGVSSCNQAAEMSLSSWGHSGVSEPCFVSHSSLLLGHVLHLGAGCLLWTEDAGWVLT